MKRFLIGLALYALTLSGLVLTAVTFVKTSHELSTGSGSRNYTLATWLPSELAGVMTWASHNVFPMLTAALVLFLWFSVFMARRSVRKDYPRET